MKDHKNKNQNNAPRFTIKKMQNRRFRQTEAAFLKVVLEGDPYISVDELARRAGVSRSTFYRHHRAVKHILRDYENYVFHLYLKEIRPLLKTKTTTRQIYLTTLAFVANHRRPFLILLKSNSPIFIRMIDYLRPELSTRLHLSKNATKNFRIYSAEISELLVKWSKKNFPKKQIEPLLIDILYLTKTARSRLSGLKT